MNPEVNFFIHIPKTGGQTIRHLLKENYSDDQILEFYKNNKKYFGLEDAPSLDLAETEIRLIYGHFFFGWNRRFKNYTRISPRWFTRLLQQA